MITAKPTFNVFKIAFENIFSNSKPAYLNLAQFHDHPQWNKVTNFEWVYVTNKPDENFISVMQFPEGSIRQTPSISSKAPWAQICVTSEDILVDAINHYCTALPNDKEYTFHYPRLDCDVIWSNAEVVGTTTALKNYVIPPATAPAIFINKKGNRVNGYRKSTLKPRQNTLKLSITAKNYSSASVNTLISWEEEGKPIHTVASICPKPGIILQTILSLPNIVAPHTYTDTTGSGTYTTLKLDEFLMLPEFWETMFQLKPELLQLFGALTDEKLRNNVFSIYALKLLTN